MSATTIATAPAGAVAEQFEAIYAKYHARIETQLYLWINDRSTAEDLAADVFASLWRDMSQRGLQLDGIDYLYAFLKQRAAWARGLYFQRLAARREQPWQHESVQDADKSRAEAVAAALVQTNPAETVHARVDVGRILATLPAKQRRALVLRYLEDLSPETVAEQTGWPQRTVSYHTAKALNTLRVAAGVPTGTKRHECAAEKREQMRRTYRESVAAGTPLSMAELGRRFGRDRGVAATAVKDILAPVISINRKAELREGLRKALAEGTWAPGAELPTSGELAAQYGAAVTSATSVLQELAAEGLVVKLTGPGYGSQGRYHVAPATDRASQHRVARLAMVMAA